MTSTITQAISRSIAAMSLTLLMSAASAGPVNINTADAATLSNDLKGIGAAKAAAIVEYRQKHGAFRNIDELSLVKGIGQKLIDQNRVDLRVDKSTAPAVKLVLKPASSTASSAAPAAARK